MSTFDDSGVTSRAVQANDKLPILPEIAQNRTESHTPPTPGQVHRTPAPSASPPARTLTPRQLAAIPLLLEGYPDSAVDEEVGVRREAVNRWRNHHPLFIAHLNRQRQLRLAKATDRFHSLLNICMTTLEEFHDETDSDYRIAQARSATTLLRAAARTTFVQPAAPLPTDPDDVLAQLLAEGLDVAPDDSPADDLPPPPARQSASNGAPRRGAAAGSSHCP